MAKRLRLIKRPPALLVRHIAGADGRPTLPCATLRPAPALKGLVTLRPGVGLLPVGMQNAYVAHKGTRSPDRLMLDARFMSCHKVVPTVVPSASRLPPLHTPQAALLALLGVLTTRPRPRPKRRLSPLLTACWPPYIRPRLPKE